jgi:hypothetical protein
MSQKFVNAKGKGHRNETVSEDASPALRTSYRMAGKLNADNRLTALRHLVVAAQIMSQENLSRTRNLLLIVQQHFFPLREPT